MNPRFENNVAAPPPGVRGWLNRDIVGMTLTSLLSDACHEMVTAVLPGFLLALGAPAAALGYIEGAADAASSFVKLGSGWYSDRVGRRKGAVTGSYVVTAGALGLLALAVSWPMVLLFRVVSWMSRGVRSPLRSAMLADAVRPEARGKAFGLHRAGDTLGAVLGPLAGIWLLSVLPPVVPAAPYRTIFLFSLVPGGLAVAAFAALVGDRRHPARHGLKLWHAVRGLPGAFGRFLRGVGVFGLGDFSHTMLILAATVLLAPRYGTVRAVQWSALLYVVHNVFYAGAAYPVGALADRIHKPRLLAAGYVLAAAVAAATAWLMAWRLASLPLLAAVFAAAGVYIAVQDALEGAIPADLVPASDRATAYGVLGAVDGVGDFIASALVGSLWTAFSPAWGFAAAAALMLAGAATLAVNSSS